MKVLGINGGNGVMIHPLKDYLVGNLEPRAIFHTKGEKQWYSNFSVPIFNNEDRCYNQIKEADIIIGHPDCGHSSILAYSRAKKFSDPHKNESLTLFLKSIEHYKPYIWVMENLPALLKSYTKEELQDKFSDYKLIFINTSVMDFGNSQKDRVRLLVIGLHKKIKEEISIGEYILLKKRLATPYQVRIPQFCKSLLQGLTNEDISIGHVRENLDDEITLYGGFKMPLREIQRHWERYPFVKRWKVSTQENFTTAPGVYRNLDNSYPATARKANRQFNQQGLTMSPRELARIQGVPDDFIIYMDEKPTVGYWINKGRATVTKCPPYEIGVWFMDVLTNTIPNFLK